MSNVTAIVPDKWASLHYFIMYICQGVCIGFTNLFIVFVIARYPALRSRKEYIMIGAQTLADGCNQMAYLCAGVYRIIVVATNHHVILLKPWECMLNPHSLIFIWSDPIANLMLAVISFDRLLAINYPLEYIGWPATYAWTFVGLAYGYTFFVAGIGVAILLSSMDVQKATYSMTCSGLSGSFEAAGSSSYTTYYRNTSSVFATASITIYIFAWIQYKRKQNLVTPTLTSDQKRELKIQHKLLITIGMSCFCTLIFNIIPKPIGWYVYTDLAYAAWIMSNFNPLCNIIIYPLRQCVIRMGIKAWFTGKIMPADIRMWYFNQNAEPTVPLSQQQSSRSIRQPLRARQAGPGLNVSQATGV